MRGCSGGACVVAPGEGGHAWLIGGRGACMVDWGGGGMRGCSRGRVWLPPGGVHGCSGGAWFFGECMVFAGGACVVFSGGACMVFSGGAWFFLGGHA